MLELATKVCEVFTVPGEGPYKGHFLVGFHVYWYKGLLMHCETSRRFVDSCSPCRGAVPRARGPGQIRTRDWNWWLKNWSIGAWAQLSNAGQWTPPTSCSINIYFAECRVQCDDNRDQDQEQNNFYGHLPFQQGQAHNKSSLTHEHQRHLLYQTHLRPLKCIFCENYRLG